jgi:ATP-dependent protease ClpP protease subunit
MGKECLAKTKSHILYKIKNAKYELYINEFIYEEDDVLVSGLLHELNNVEKGSSIHIYIESPGGVLDTAIAIAAVVKNNFKNITTEIVYKASSMGSIIFMLGDKRITNKYSRLMLHSFKVSYSLNVSNVTGDKHKFFHKLHKKIFTDSYKDFLTKKELKNMFNGKEHWFNSNEMLSRGFATHIRINGELNKYTEE